MYNVAEMLKKTIRAGRILLKVANYIIVVAVFVVAAFIIITYSAGYKVDLKNRDFQFSALLEVNTETDGAQIYLDETKAGEKNATAKNLTPGTHRLKVSKDGYQTFEQNINLAESEAKTLSQIVLFKKNPEVSETKSLATSQTLTELADSSSMSFSAGEIYQNDKLVTRLSSEVAGLSWYPNRNYIAFTSDGYLKIIRIDGTNLVDLAKKDSISPVVFANSGRSVIYENAGKIYEAVIR